MPWNSTWPNGNVSVKVNQPTGQENTTYIEQIMNTNHFWNSGSNIDGNHKFVQAPVQDTDPDLLPGMDGVLYLKNSADGSVLGFFGNQSSVIQFVPQVLSISAFTINSTMMVSLANVPNNSFGYVYVYIPDGSESGQFGYFTATGGTCQAYAIENKIWTSGSNSIVATNIDFGNGPRANGLAIRVALGDDGESSTNYSARVVYWGL